MNGMGQKVDGPPHSKFRPPRLQRCTLIDGPSIIFAPGQQMHAGHNAQQPTAAPSWLVSPQ